MKVVYINASPKNSASNSKKIANAILDKLRDEAEIEVFKLSEMDIIGCSACDICKNKEESCPRRDDTSKIINAIKECDVLIISTPIFFANIPGNLKSVIDRTYSFLKPDYMESSVYHGRLKMGKTLVYIQTHGLPIENYYDSIAEEITTLFKIHGFTNLYTITASGMNDRGSTVKIKEAIAKAEEIADKLH